MLAQDPIQVADFFLLPLTNFHKICIFQSVIDEGRVFIKFKVRRIKLIVFIVAFITIFYVSFTFHFTHNPVDRKLNNLYRTIKNPETREAGFAGFFEYGKRSGDYLITKLPVETDDMLKSDIINVIGHLGCTDCVEKLIPFLNDPDSRVRFFTIDALDELKYENISTILPDIIRKDNYKNVKIKAIMTLGKYGGAKDIDFLENLSKQKEYKEKNLTKAINNALSRLKLKRSIQSGE